jgi:heme A synthase
LIRRPMETVHLVVGVAVLITNLVAGVIGATAWLRREPSVPFWYVLRVAQATVVLQVLLGAILLLIGNEAPDSLHYVYGVLPLFVSLLAEAVRAGAAERELEGVDFDALPKDRQHAFALAIVRRETGIMAVSALVVFGLALRAAGTSGHLF